MYWVISKAKPRSPFYSGINFGMAAAWAFLFLISAQMGKPLAMAITALFVALRLMWAFGTPYSDAAPSSHEGGLAPSEQPRHSSFYLPLALAVTGMLGFVESVNAGQPAWMVMSALLAVTTGYVAIRNIAETPIS